MHPALEHYYSYYVCCRDENYKPSKQPRKKQIKLGHTKKPSRKLGTTCISWMYATKFSSRKMDVKFHSNHNPDDDVVPLPVSTKDCYET